MAFETEKDNFIHVTNVISDGITPALVNPLVVAPLIRYEALPVGTMTKLLRKDGYLSAETIAESAVQAIDGADNELTQASITATAKKIAASMFLTVEAQDFVGISPAAVTRYLGEALGRNWDAEIKALAAGFSRAVTSTSVMTINDILQGVYLVRSGTAGVSTGQLVCVLDFKGINEIQKELTASAASHLSIPSEIALISGLPQTNGLVGVKAGVSFYQTSGLPTSAADNVGMLYDPLLAFGGMISPAPMVIANRLGATGDGTRSFGDMISAYMYSDCKEWNDLAGVKLLSDS